MEIINLDMTPSTVTPNAHAGQYDASRTVRFMLKNGGVPFTLAGTETITAEITRSDNTEVTVNVANTSSNYVDVVFDDTVCTVKGLYACELRLKDSDGFDIGSKNFALLVQRDPYDGAGVHVETIGPADICTFETNLAEPLKSVIVDVEASQDLHGYDHPWTGGTGKNKLPLDANIIKNYNGGYSAWTDNEYTISGITFRIIEDADNGVTEIKANGTATADIVFRLCYGTPYLVINNSITVIMQNTSRGGLKYDGVWTDVMPTPLTLANVTNIEEFWVLIANGATLNNANITPMICLSTTVDYTYEPYSNICPISGYSEANITANGNTVTIAFGSTVFYGEADATRGKLHVTRGSVDLGTLTWGRLTSGGKICFKTSAELSDAKKRTSSSELMGLLCTNYFEDTWVNTIDGAGPDGSIALGWNNNAYIGIYDSTKTSMTAADFKTAMNGVLLVYELATPFDIDLTPEVISAIVGENNVSADCGETEVKYLKAGG